MDVVEIQTCRLCFSTQNQQINLFNGLELNKNVTEVIAEHIGEVSISDALPKSVCVECWHTTDTFHKFHQFVKSAQADYLNELVKCESEGDSDVNESFGAGDIKPHDFVEIIQNDNVFGNLVEAIYPNVKNDKFDKFHRNEITSVNMADVLELMPANIAADTLPQLNEIHDIEENLLIGDAKLLKRDFNAVDSSNGSDSMDAMDNKNKRRTRKSMVKRVGQQLNLDAFVCDFCGKEFTRKANIVQHFFKHVNTFKCKLCPSRFLSREELERHQIFYHDPANAVAVRKQMDLIKELNAKSLSPSEIEQTMSEHFDMTCDICGDAFKSLQQAQFHYMHEHQVPNGYVKCCGMIFNKILAIKGHIFWHMNSEMFKCSICGQMKKTVQHIRTHLRGHKIRLDPSENTCVKCNRIFSSKSSLNEHLQKVHGIRAKDSNRYSSVSSAANASNAMQCDLSMAEVFDMTCDVCKVTLASLQHAKLHYLDEHGIADGYIKCCDLKFKEFKQVNDHLQYHSNPDIFKCHICDKKFSKKVRLISHMHHHKTIDSKRYNCFVCDRAFKSKEVLDIHARRHDPSKKPEKKIPCELCDKRFPTEQAKKYHQDRVHPKSENLKSEICEFCAQTFHTRSQLFLHIRKAHSTTAKPYKRVQCEVCDTWLSNRYTLKDHMLRHTAEPQKCPQCDKISPNHSALTNHIRNVHTERTHKCHLCDKSFKADYALKSHIAIHTGEKPFKCTHCPKSFIWRTEVYKHRKRAHPDEYDQIKRQRGKV